MRPGLVVGNSELICTSFPVYVEIISPEDVVAVFVGKFDGAKMNASLFTTEITRSICG